ncbi:unnamed protein product, partial [Sphacelaria rigidula]
GAVVAIVAIRTWRRRAAGSAILSKTFGAWANRVQRSADVNSHLRHAFLRRGIERWRVVARESMRRVSGAQKTAEIAVSLLRGKGRRRLRAWRERRRRQSDAYRTADGLPRQLTGCGDAQAVATILPWIRRRVCSSLLLWAAVARERTGARAARAHRCSASLALARNSNRRRGIKVWHESAVKSGLRKRLVERGEAYGVRRRAMQGLHGLRVAARRGVGDRAVLEMADMQRRRRGAIWVLRRVR